MSAPYDPNFVGHVDADAKAAFQQRIVEKLSEVLEQEVEGVMAEYIVVMIGNQKTMKEIHDEMVDFMGAESAEAAVACIYTLLLEPPNAAAEASPSPSPPSSSPEPVSEEPANAAPPKKIVNLSGVKSSSTTVEVSGKTSSTIRVIGNSSKDLKDALKSRSERFGIPEKKLDKPAAQSSRQTTTKLSITERLGGRVTDKKDLAASRGDNRSRQESRDTNNKRKSGGDFDDSSSRSNKDVEESDQRPSKRPARDPKGSDLRYPPGPGGHGPRGGPYPFPPMFQGYPPYHMPPPEFMYPPYPPPHHMPGFGYPGMPRGPYQPRMPHGAGAPRRFNNKWVNPTTASAEGDAKANGDPADPTNEPHNQTTPYPGGGPASSLAPRAYGFGYPRPRFQNKTWVRPDPKETTPQADETLSASLPKTP
ncbi:hypothetical protein H310_04410 [Aphanomyces invadans]|uniref:PWI domain-containing protein n=1 Tax=Aphanomyces invadans TaxID=157072 RepID=A0A024UCS3_9STRA|nr:hypothetical protein H310_04410 [Aphanomyces invadans]ETW04005.1 hypothetical protein H310_04410 [Aphanomyces invadans]|eukprot:XP_008866961.1 hypothetical protein H310_04410 [Aphanomyces invadans]